MGNFDFESGTRFMEEGELVEALRCFLASVDADPTHVPTYLALFSAYEHAWHESGDPMVLDQMRKVAMAGLKRDPAPEQRQFLEEAIDRTDVMLLEVQREEEAAQDFTGAPRANEVAARDSTESPKGEPVRRRLPLI